MGLFDSIFKLLTGPTFTTAVLFCSPLYSSPNVLYPKYISAYDADTFKVDIPRLHWLIGKNISIRIRGIDAPEMSSDSPCEHELAVKARDRLRELLTPPKQIRLENLGRDKYFRILADVYSDDKSVAPILIKEGHAKPYDGGTKDKDWCK